MDYSSLIQNVSIFITWNCNFRKSYSIFVIILYSFSGIILYSIFIIDLNEISREFTELFQNVHLNYE